MDLDAAAALECSEATWGCRTGSKVYPHEGCGGSSGGSDDDECNGGGGSSGHFDSARLEAWLLGRLRRGLSEPTSGGDALRGALALLRALPAEAARNPAACGAVVAAVLRADAWAEAPVAEAACGAALAAVLAVAPALPASSLAAALARCGRDVAMARISCPDGAARRLARRSVGLTEAGLGRVGGRSVWGGLGRLAKELEARAAEATATTVTAAGSAAGAAGRAAKAWRLADCVTVEALAAARRLGPALARRPARAKALWAGLADAAFEAAEAVVGASPAAAVAAAAAAAAQLGRGEGSVSGRAASTDSSGCAFAPHPSLVLQLWHLALSQSVHAPAPAPPRPPLRAEASIVGEASAGPSSAGPSPESSPEPSPEPSLELSLELSPRSAAEALLLRLACAELCAALGPLASRSALRSSHGLPHTHGWQQASGLQPTCLGRLPHAAWLLDFASVQEATATTIAAAATAAATTTSPAIAGAPSGACSAPEQRSPAPRGPLDRALLLLAAAHRTALAMVACKTAPAAAPHPASAPAGAAAAAGGGGGAGANAGAGAGGNENDADADAAGAIAAAVAAVVASELEALVALGVARQCTLARPAVARPTDDRAAPGAQPRGVVLGSDVGIPSAVVAVLAAAARRPTPSLPPPPATAPLPRCFGRLRAVLACDHRGAPPRLAAAARVLLGPAASSAVALAWARIDAADARAPEVSHEVAATVAAAASRAARVTATTGAGAPVGEEHDDDEKELVVEDLGLGLGRRKKPRGCGRGAGSDRSSDDDNDNDDDDDDDDDGGGVSGSGSSMRRAARTAAREPRLCAVPSDVALLLATFLSPKRLCRLAVTASLWHHIATGHARPAMPATTTASSPSTATSSVVAAAAEPQATAKRARVRRRRASGPEPMCPGLAAIWRGHFERRWGVQAWPPPPGSIGPGSTWPGVRAAPWPSPRPALPPLPPRLLPQQHPPDPAPPPPPLPPPQWQPDWRLLYLARSRAAAVVRGRASKAEGWRWRVCPRLGCCAVLRTPATAAKHAAAHARWAAKDIAKETAKEAAKKW